jgi:hypothetical protein
MVATFLIFIRLALVEYRVQVTWNTVHEFITADGDRSFTYTSSFPAASLSEGKTRIEMAGSAIGIDVAETEERIVSAGLLHGLVEELAINRFSRRIIRRRTIYQVGARVAEPDP